jgi:hypothetical protein
MISNTDSTFFVYSTEHIRVKVYTGRGHLVANRSRSRYQKMRSAFLMTHVTQVLVVALAGAAVLAAPTRETSHFKVLHNFGAGKDGAVPPGPLSLDGGDLYGGTYDGGTGEV